MSNLLFRGFKSKFITVEKNKVLYECKIVFES
jgi:hypothetical protein